MPELHEITPYSAVSKRLKTQAQRLASVQIGLQILAPHTTPEIEAGLGAIVEQVQDLQARTTGLLMQLVEHENQEAFSDMAPGCDYDIHPQTDGVLPECGKCGRTFRPNEMPEDAP